MKPLVAPHPHVPRERPALRILDETLLVAGVLSALLYIATDLTSAALYPNYDVVDQAISELSATGAPTAGLWGTAMIAYEILFLSFAVGVFRASSGNRRFRIGAILMVAMALSGPLWSLVPMGQRGTTFTWHDAGHIAMGALSVALIVAIVGFGAFALGRSFRTFSLAMAAVIFATGVYSFAMAPRLAANQPTPWLGIVERVTLYAYQAWIATLSIALLVSRGRGGTDRAR